LGAAAPSAPDQRIALELAASQLRKLSFSHIAGPTTTSARCRAFAEDRENECLNDQICAFSELRMTFIHGLRSRCLSRPLSARTIGDHLDNAA